MKFFKRKEPVTDYGTVTGNGGYNRGSNRWFGWFAKIASILIAFGIWIYASEHDATVENMTFRDIPIKIVNTSDVSLEIISGYNSTIDISVEGKRTTLRSITADDLIVSADVSGITTAGMHTVPVSIITPDGTSVVAQSFSTISVYMDNTTSVTVPVRVGYKSYILDEGYELGEAVPNVSQITVTGPASVLSGKETASVELDLGHVSGSVTVSEGITLLDSQGAEIDNPYVKLQISTVTVDVPVYISKTLPLVVDFKYGYLNSSNSLVTIVPGQIKVKGEVAVLEGIDEITLATLDEKRISGETIQKIVLPEGVSLVSEDSVADSTATVKITHIGTTTKSIVIEEFTVENPNGLDYELQNKTISLNLRGPEDVLASVTAENIEATLILNYEKSVSGISNVPIEISITGAGSGVYEIGEYTVPVKLGN